MREDQSLSTTSLRYTPHGYCHAWRAAPSLGFNGQIKDPLTGHYHLGVGYRNYSPTLMRFLAPDTISPFGAGGINCYAYCDNDPINYKDPSGHMKSSTTQPSSKQTPLHRSSNTKLTNKHDSFMNRPLKRQKNETPKWAWDYEIEKAPVTSDPWVDDLVARTLHSIEEPQTWFWDLDTSYEAPVTLDPWTYRQRNSTQLMMLKADQKVNTLTANLPADLDTRAISLTNFSRDVRQGGSGNVFSRRVGLIGRLFE